MIKLVVLLFFSFYANCGITQQEQIPNGVYNSVELFNLRTPTNQMPVVKQALTKRKAKKNDYRACTMQYSVNGQKIKDAFAVVTNDEIYLNADKLSKALIDSYQIAENHLLRPTGSYLRVNKKFMFWTIEAVLHEKKSGAAVGAILAGPGGAMIGSSIDGDRNHPATIIYHTKTKKFKVIADCFDIKKLSKEYEMNISYLCTVSKEIYPSDVERLIDLINKKHSMD